MTDCWIKKKKNQKKRGPSIGGIMSQPSPPEGGHCQSPSLRTNPPDLCNYLMACWSLKCFSCMAYMLAWLIGAEGKPWHKSDEWRVIVPIVCFVCHILSVVTAGRVPHGVRQRQGEWLADGRPPARPCPAAPGANRWTQRYCCRIVAVRAGGMEPDTLCGPVARRGSGLARWQQRWQQGRQRRGPRSGATQATEGNMAN